ncbi:MAG TPA: phosphoesterase [Ruminococcaceae bacterium]|nr:phosphoesterase [Oscillospiraceae bacterium]
MRFYYDLHLHSCLSPCGDDDMTPYNLVNMAALLGLDIIALTDHNSSLNCPAALAAADKAGVLLIPGMELCTSEEIHVICLFETPDGAAEFDRYVSSRLPDIANRPEIFGNQLIMDSGDTVTGRVVPLLINAADISVMDVTALTGAYGGIAFPAHIDRPAYSILSALGDIPPDCGFTAAEISARPQNKIPALKKNHPALMDFLILSNSDAHSLGNMKEKNAWIDLPERSSSAVISAIKKSGNYTGFDG